MAGMRYLLAIFVPPLAVLLCLKPFQFIASAILYVAGLATAFAGFGFLLLAAAALHAVLVVNSSQADKRNKRLMAAVRERS